MTTLYILEGRCSSSDYAAHMGRSVLKQRLRCTHWKVGARAETTLYTLEARCLGNDYAVHIGKSVLRQ